MKKGLLIIDVQNDYFEGGKMELQNFKEALDNIIKLKELFKQQKLPIFYIQHIKKNSSADFFKEGTRGAEIHSRLLPIGSNEYIIQKEFPNSFLSTMLQDKLEEESVEQLVICGMMTHMCVDSSTRKAKELNFSPILIYDGCATKDLLILGNTISAKNVHLSFVSALTNFAEVKSTREYLQS